jgi:hypothetical protein
MLSKIRRSVSKEVNAGNIVDVEMELGSTRAKSSATAGGRPHVMCHAASNKYVLWPNVGNGYVVATSSPPICPCHWMWGAPA